MAAKEIEAPEWLVPGAQVVLWKDGGYGVDEPVGTPWIDDQPIDGWQLYKADGGRMQPIAAPGRGLPFVKTHAALRICPRGVHR